MQGTEAFACPFCGAPIAVVRQDLGEDECTGGYGTLTDFRCRVCQARIEQFVHDKFRWRRETWRLLEKPVRFAVERGKSGSGPVYACAERRCGGDLWAAVPEGAGVAEVGPETALTRTLPFVCERCGSEYVRSEKGTWGAPAVTGWARLGTFVWRLRGWRLRKEPAPFVPVGSPRAPKERTGH